MIDLLGGHLSLGFDAVMTTLPYAQTGKLRMLAVSSLKRSAVAPQVPTMAESGFPGFEETAPWVGLLAPTGTPAAIVKRLSDEMRKSVVKPETVTRMKALGAITVGDTPAEYGQFLKKDYERWARVIKAAGVKAE